MDFFRTPSQPSAHQRRPSRHNEPAWEVADGATWRDIALKLVKADRLGVYGGEDWSCNDLELYGMCAYGFTLERTEEVLRIGKKLLELPEIDRAFCDGWLTWEQVVVLTRVAVTKHEAAWLGRALDLSLEDLALLVERSAEGWAPPVARDRRAQTGGATLGSMAETHSATSWRGPAILRGDASSLRSRLQGRIAAGLDRRRHGRSASATGFWRDGGAPNVRHRPGAPPSTS